MRTVVLIALGVFLGISAWEMVQYLAPISYLPQEPDTVQISYTDFVSIMLTGISIILAALGFVIALLAFIGWNSIGAKVKETAEEFLAASVEDGGELHEAVRKEAREIYRYQGVEAVDTDFVEEGQEN